MSKEKQIEEMAKIIDKPCFEILNEAGVIDRECPFPYECAECTARNIYNAGYRKQEWISVEERLPEEKVMVLGYVFTNFDNGDTSDGIYVMELINGLFYPFNCSAIKGNSKVTHWMPLPEAPKMKVGEG